jgi:uncharacterized membrane protein
MKFGNKHSFEYMIIEFSLIIILCLFVFFTDQTLSFSRNILGKFLTVSLLIFYTSVNVIYGLIFCLLVIIYYKTDFVEQLLNMNDGEQNNQIIHIEKTELLKPTSNQKAPVELSISQDKITVEDDITKPKNSNDSFLETWTKIWESINLYPVTPSIGIYSEPFSFLQ